MLDWLNIFHGSHVENSNAVGNFQQVGKGSAQLLQCEFIKICKNLVSQ